MGCRKLPYTPLHPSFSFPEHYQRNPAGTCFPAGLFVVIGIYCSLYGTSQRSNPFRFLHVNRSFLKLNRISFARSHTIFNWRFPSESTSNSPYPHVSLPKIPSANESAAMFTPVIDNSSSRTMSLPSVSFSSQEYVTFFEIMFFFETKFISRKS